MAINVYIPARENRGDIAAYASGKVREKVYDRSGNVMLVMEGCATVFHHCSNTRRAYVLCEDGKWGGMPLMSVAPPMVTGASGLIYFAEGRRVDLLKFLLHNLESDFGDDVYILGPEYWLSVTSLLDVYDPKKRRSLSTRRNLAAVTRKFLRQRGRRNRCS